MLNYPCYFLSILIFLLDGAAKPVPSHGEVAVKTQLVLGIVDLFNQLPTDPLVVPLQTDIPFDEEGGHVQGFNFSVKREVLPHTLPAPQTMRLTWHRQGWRKKLKCRLLTR